MPEDPTLPPLYDWVDPLDRPAHPLIRAWEAHLDAGRLTHAPRRPRDPAIAANLADTDRLFRERAAFARWQRMQA